MNSKKFQNRKNPSFQKTNIKRTQEEIENILKNFDLMVKTVNAVNKKKFSSTDFASYIVEAERILKFSVLAHYPPVCHFSDSLWYANVINGKKKIKVIFIRELFSEDYLSKNIKDKVTHIRSKDNLTHFLNGLQHRLVESARLYIKSKKKLTASTQIDRIKLNPIEIEEVDWEIFPVGDWINKEEIPNKLFEHFRKLQSKGIWRNKIFDKNRIDEIYHKLNPVTYRTGKKKFEGYVVYFFDWTDKIILECPIYGNATYVISAGKSPWQEIAKNSKWEARNDYSDQVTVINHSENWIERLEQNLKYGC